MDSPAAWYPDPDDPSLLRWWDGTEWTSETATAPVAPAGEHAPARRRRHPRPLFWILSALVVLAALIGLGSGGIGSFLVVLGVATGATALYALIRKRPSWAGLPPGIGLRTAIVALSAVLVVGGGVAYGATHTAPSQRLSLAVPTADHVTSSEHAHTPVATQTPTPTPTPIQLADYAGQSPASAEDALEAAGFAVTMSTSDGSAAPADWTGWTVAREVPAGGQAIAPGSTVTLVMSPPVPPAPAPPAPAAPVPPVAPGGGATAQCNDGTYSYAAHHQGACSHHGGVRVFYK